MDTDKLYEKSQTLREDELIVDIRTPEEYNEGHIAGAVNIPLAELRHERLQKTHAYLYCRTGGRVRIAKDILEAEGLTNATYVLSGGIKEWKERGYPLTSCVQKG